MRFEPSGLTNDADIRAAKSLVDYIFRWMGKKFLDTDTQQELGILSPEVRKRPRRPTTSWRTAAVPRREAAPAPPPGQTALFNALRGRGRVRQVRRPDGQDGLVLHVPGLRAEHLVAS